MKLKEFWGIDMYIEFTTKQLKTGTISAECEEEDLFEEGIKAMTFLAFKILMKMDHSTGSEPYLVKEQLFKESSDFLDPLIEKYSKSRVVH